MGLVAQANSGNPQSLNGVVTFDEKIVVYTNGQTFNNLDIGEAMAVRFVPANGAALSCTVNGIASASRNGRPLTIVSAGGSVVLAPNAAGSAAANRFTAGATLASGQNFEYFWDGALGAWSAGVAITAAGAASSVAVALAAIPGAVNLTAEGTLDWQMWNASGVYNDAAKPSVVLRKLGGGYQIFGLYSIGGDPTGTFDYTAISTVTYGAGDCQTQVAAGGNETGVYFATNANGGMRLFAEATTSQRVLRLYFSNGAPWDVTATLTDGATASGRSAATTNQMVTITYTAQTPGQILTVHVAPEGANNVGFIAATLGIV